MNNDEKTYSYIDRAMGFKVDDKPIEDYSYPIENDEEENDIFDTRWEEISQSVKNIDSLTEFCIENFKYISHLTAAMNYEDLRQEARLAIWIAYESQDHARRAWLDLAL